LNRVDLRVCFIGDSFVAGTGDPEALGWVGRVTAAALREGHPLTTYNLGVRRETSGDIRQRWKQEVMPRVMPGSGMRVVFSFGANDTAIHDRRRRLTLEATLANTQAILSDAQASWPVLMIGPPPVADEDHDKRIAELSDALHAVADTLGVPYLDVFTPLMALPAWRQEAAANDGSHPRAAGYRELAELVMHWPAWWFHPGSAVPG